MTEKPTYEELEQRIKELEHEVDNLEQDRDMFNMFLEHSNVGINLIDAETGERVAFNRYSYESLDYTREEYQRLAPWDFQLDESEKTFKDRSREVIRKGSELFEARHRMRSGEIRDRLISIVPVMIADRRYIQAITIDITDRKKIEVLLHEQERKYKNLFDNAPDGITLLDSKGYVLDCNKKEQMLLGLSQEETTGKHITSFLSDESRPLFQKLFPVLKKTGMVEVESEIINGEGDAVPVWRCVNAVYDDSGAFEGAIVHTRNITDRRKAEKDLRESEEKYRKLFEHSGFGITLIDAETGERVEFNTMAHEQLGYSRDEFRNLTLSKADQKKSRQEVYEHRQRIIRKGSDTFEAKHKTKNGEIRDVLISSVAVKIGDRHLLNEITTDITDRKQAEKLLRESERYNRAMLDNSPTPVLIVNPDTSIRHFNPALEKLTGYSLAELEGMKAPYPWWSDDPRSGNLKKRKKSVDKGIKDLEMIFRKKSGEDFWVQINTVPIIEDGKHKYSLTNWADITERKKAEEELIRSEKEHRSTLDNLLAGVVVHAQDTGILFCNPAASNMLGLTIDQMSGKKAIDPAWCFLNEDSTVMKVKDYPVNIVASTKEPLHDYIVGIEKPDRDCITWVTVNAIPVFSSDS